MKNVILIGMPGTGKSKVGVILAKRIGYDFLDEDIAITLKDGRQLSEIIEQEGIDRFLEIEGEVGLSIEAEKTVIATGGSAVFSDDAMRHFKENGRRTPHKWFARGAGSGCACGDDAVRYLRPERAAL